MLSKSTRPKGKQTQISTPRRACRLPSPSGIVTSDEGSWGQSPSGFHRKFSPLIIFGKSSRLRRSSLLTHNHRGSLQLLHNVTDEELNHLVSLWFSWQRTCENAFSHSSQNEELTCCLSKVRNQYSVAYLTLLTILSRRKETVAAESSKRRTETAFKGATRNFPKRKGQWTLPLLLTKWR